MISDATGERAGGQGRLSTGIDELDQILGGGFPERSITIVMGHPGTGKTVFAEQMVFHNADGDRPILYLTTLSEPLAKVLTYLQTFTFFDQERFMKGVVYDDIGPALSEHGPQAVVERVREAIRDLGPKIVVVDSFKAIHDLAESPRAMRSLTSELARTLSAYDTTAFLVGEYDAEQIPLFPEFAIADGIIEFERRGTAKRDERFVRLLKLRGSSYAEGFHAFTISEEGIEVFPRLVTRDTPVDYTAREERIPTGVEGLDPILDGGLWKGSTILVTGTAGSGKTTLGLQYAIEGVRQGDPSLVLNFQENPTQLAQTVRALGVDLDDLRKRGLMFQYASPVELRIDTIVVDLFETVRREGVGRVVIDCASDLALAATDQQRIHDYLYSLGQHLKVHGVTTLMTYEMRSKVSTVRSMGEGRFSSMSDVLFELEIDMTGEPRRTFRVAKARGIGHDMRIHEMRIGSSGMRIGDAVDPR